MSFFSVPEPPERRPAEEAGDGARNAVHAVGLIGMVVLPFLLVVGSLMTAFRKWGYLSDEQRAAIDHEAFPLMIAAGVILGVSALAVIVLRVRLRAPFAGGTIWAGLAVLALPVAFGLVVVGVANL